MKVGILTFHQADNYGAVMQTYALQQTLIRLGADCEIIDYPCAFIQKEYALMPPVSFVSPRSLMGGMVRLPFVYQRRKGFAMFREKYLKLGPRVIKSHDSLLALTASYDLIISGSDQVWNHKCSLEAMTYMLDWVADPKRKASYAASFGYSEIPPAYAGDAARYGALLSSFTHLSVREAQSAAIVRDLTGREVPVVLDPTLLLNAEVWANCAWAGTECGAYILLHCFERPQRLFDFAQALSQKTGLPIRYISDDPIRRVHAEHVRGCSPMRFLGLLKGARYVVTNSFHVIAFSINLEKQFFVDELPPPSLVNARLKHILGFFGLEDRWISDMDISNLPGAIDYRPVRTRLEKARRASFRFLEGLLGHTDE